MGDNETNLVANAPEVVAPEVVEPNYVLNPDGSPMIGKDGNPIIDRRRP